jgi:fibronectin-binding autotransporter adhesin
MNQMLPIANLKKNFNSWRYGKRCLLASAVATLLIVVDSTTYAQSIFSNPITGINPSINNPYTTGQTVNPNITVSGIGRGTGNLGANAVNRYSAIGWNTVALNPTAYFEWTLTPNATFEIDYVSLLYTGQRSATGPNSFAIRSSLDSFGSDVFTTIASSTSTVGFSVPLSAASFQNVTGGITFRLYGWGATSSPGTFSVNDFTFNGNVGPAATFPYTYWDPNGNTAGIGGAGTWSAAGINWATDNTGTVTGLQSLTSPGIFAGTGGAVTVSGSVAPKFGFKVNSNGYTFDDATAFTLASAAESNLVSANEITLDGVSTADNTIEVANSVSTSISTVLGGTAGMTKAGAGSLTLAGVNTFTGTLDVTGGSVILGADNALVDSVDVKVAGTFDINSRNDAVSQVTLTSGAITGTTGTLTATSYNAVAGTISANLVGTGGPFLKTGTGTVTLSGNNSFNGAVRIFSGTLAVASPTALGTSPASTISFLGGTLQYSAGNTVDYSPRFANSLTETVQIDTNGQNVTFASPLTSSGGSLVKSGEGKLTLAGTNTYDAGTTINAGTIKATSNTALGSGSVTMNNQSNLVASAGTTVPNNIVVSATPIGTMLAGWDFSTIAGAADFYGPSPFAPAYTGAGITTSGLVRGSGISTTGGTSPNNAWGGINFLASTDAATGIAANRFATVTISSTNLLNLTEISAYNIRRSSTGPTMGQWQYQVGAGAFVDIGSPITWGLNTSAAGNPQTAIDLSGISALQGLPANTNVTFRIIPYAATGTMGTWNFNDPTDTTAIDFSIRGAYGAIVSTGPTIGIDEAGSSTFTGTIAANGFTTLTAVAGGTANFQGIITGVGTIEKTGAGIVTMSADNNYTGMTLINAGTLRLLIAGTNNIPNSNEIRLSGGTLDVSAVTGAGGFALATGQVLSGSGSVTGSVTAGTSTEVRPGEFNAASTLNFGPLTLSGASLFFDLGAASDLIDLNTAVLTGTGINTFTLNNLTGFGVGNYTLIDYGTLADGTSLSNFALSSPTLAGFDLSLVDNGSAIILKVVPEPSTLVLAGLGLMAFAGVRLRRRQLAKSTM